MVMSSPVRLAAASSPRVRHDGRCDRANICWNWKVCQYKSSSAKSVLAYAYCAVASVILRPKNHHARIPGPVEQEKAEDQGDGD
jgi:hypothetical protein